MLYAQFGYDQLENSNLVDDLCRTLAAKVDNITAQMLLREAYETSYHIYNHDAADANPLAVVSHHYKEDVCEYGPLYRMFHTYRLKDINKHWGLSIEEFLALPREYTELMISIVDDELGREQQRQQKLEDDLRESQASVKRQ